MKPAYRITGNDLQDLLKRLARQPETVSHRKPGSRNGERPDRAARRRVPTRQGAGK
ncbi:hypothetical protein [Salaquimonas pukyongi]|uniref:hypothetical protein n=1 Tax=Salaquimonas pukyongi TaxID=2712698 RepID=UPI0012EC5546|nr:hypothetical protein [Salaquimonas pukyongi]